MQIVLDWSLTSISITMQPMPIASTIPLSSKWANAYYVGSIWSVTALISMGFFKILLNSNT